MTRRGECHIPNTYPERFVRNKLSKPHSRLAGPAPIMKPVVLLRQDADDQTAKNQTDETSAAMNYG
jgi:hypothetical protein